MLNGRLVQAPTTRADDSRPASLALLHHGVSGGVSASRSGRLAARLARRRLEAGFTLIELMVVVVLIAILAMIAAPAMRIARDDRMAFDYARQIQQMTNRARTRAAARGGAHLILVSPSGIRGRVFLFEALDGTAAPLGPNPSSSCRTVNQWAAAPVFDPAVPVANPNSAFVEGLDLDSNGVNVDADIRAAFLITDPADPTVLVPTAAMAICITPNGTVFAAEGANMAAAIANMQQRAPFTGIAEIRDHPQQGRRTGRPLTQRDARGRGARSDPFAMRKAHLNATRARSSRLHGRRGPHRDDAVRDRRGRRHRHAARHDPGR